MLTSNNSTTVFIPTAGHVSVSRRDLHVRPEEARAEQLKALIDHYDKLACHDGYEASKALESYDAAIDENRLRHLIEAYWQEYVSLSNSSNDAKAKRDNCKAELRKLLDGGQS